MRPAQLPILLTVATILLLAGCGAKPSPTPSLASGAAQPKTSTQRSTPLPKRDLTCKVVPAPARPERGPVHPVGSTVSVKLPTGRVTIRVQQALVFPALVSRFGRDALLHPARGSFLAIVYRVRNVGNRPIKPSSTIGKGFIVGFPAGRLYRAADFSPDCGTASAAYTVAAKIGFPPARLKPGKSSRTAVVYVVPAATGLSWVSQATGDAFDLPTVRPAKRYR